MFLFFAVCVLIFSLCESKNVKNVVKRNAIVDESDWRMPGSSLSDSEQKQEYVQFLYDMANTDQEYQEYLDVAKELGIQARLKRSMATEEVKKPKSKI